MQYKPKQAFVAVLDETGKVHVDPGALADPGLKPVIIVEFGAVEADLSEKGCLFKGIYHDDLDVFEWPELFNETSKPGSKLYAAGQETIKKFLNNLFDGPLLRKLKTNWSMESCQDLRSVHNIDVTQQLADIMTKDIIKEINRETIKKSNPDLGQKFAIDSIVVYKSYNLRSRI